MDTNPSYRDIVKKIILRYSKFRPSHGDIRLDVVFDDDRDRYSLMQVGWDRGRRIRGNLIYVTIRDGKVYIEYDGIEHGIADELIAAGIPEEDIVFAFLPDSLKQEPIPAQAMAPQP